MILMSYLFGSDTAYYIVKMDSCSSDESHSIVVSAEDKWSGLFGSSKNLWIYGATGTGKTSFVNSVFPIHYTYIFKARPWDNYDNEDFVFVDDLSLSNTKDYARFRVLLGCSFTSRGMIIFIPGRGHIFINPKHFIITSLISPYEMLEENVGLLGRVASSYIVISMEQLCQRYSSYVKSTSYE